MTLFRRLTDVTERWATVQGDVRRPPRPGAARQRGRACQQPPVKNLKWLLVAVQVWFSKAVDARDVPILWLRRFVHRLLTPELLTFLTVGGIGYVVDVTVFNVLRSISPWSTLDPSVARTLAVMAAMCVTFIGNRTVTWRDRPSRDRRHEVILFVVFNVIGFGFSIVTLTISHDVMGLTSRLADNISANVVGLALGTAFRFVTYKYVVFRPARPRASVNSRA
jgi:putative flippase GtrA